MDVEGLGISSTEQDKAEKEAKKISDYLKRVKEAEGGNNIATYQAGIGLLRLDKKNSDGGYDEVASKDETSNGTLGNQSLGGSLNEISTHYSVTYKKNIALLGKTNILNGLYLLPSSDKRFRNLLYTGDSGSGFFIYDTLKKKWVLAGVLSVANGENNYASIVTKTDFDDYRKAYEERITNTPLSGGLSSKNKDLIFSKPNSKITFNSDLDLGHGGIVVEKNAKLTLEKGNSGNSYKIISFAGFDISEGASLDLKVSATTSIHKIGKGKLIVNSTGNKTLRLGGARWI